MAGSKWRWILPGPSKIALIVAVLWYFKYDPSFVPKPFATPTSRYLTGALAPERIIGEIEYLANGQVNGPESIVLRNGSIYTTSLSCDFVKIVDGNVVQRFGFIQNKSCSHCCFALGMRHWKNDKFIIADGHLGLLVGDYKTETVRQIMASTVLVGRYLKMFADDFDFIDENTIVLSDMTPVCGVENMIKCIVLNAEDSRLLKVDLLTGATTVLLDEQPAMNGVQRHVDGQSVLINQMPSSRVMRYYFTGPKNGQLEIFADGLPGLPDNIRVSSKGNTYWVSLYASIPGNSRFMFQTISTYSTTSKRLISAFLDLLPDKLQLLITCWGFTTNNIFIELDQNGEIIRSLHDTEGKLSATTQVIDDGEFLYFGSITKQFVAKARLI